MKLTFEGEEKEIAGLLKLLQTQQSGQSQAYVLAREPYARNYKAVPVVETCGLDGSFAIKGE